MRHLDDVSRASSAESLVEDSSTIWPEPQIDDHAECANQTIEGWRSTNGQKGGDRAMLAQALVALSDAGGLPLRFFATVQGQMDVHRELSASLSYDA
ncbi:hypothetical protein [Pseudofrankia sp. BMG5.36]|uniref:hypothetical protein n=1 Tax=Pseudofrankia sp. BMG5.36 TaxID=1834512 RepID=UPI0008D8E9C3|nr:hypothetical protein [Pseudofrankia sp. BMG5.36]OHV54816.1 hypothetical protein BCD48_44420 [Pseudofrankia sp. BMG5.36]